MLVKKYGPSKLSYVQIATPLVTFPVYLTCPGAGKTRYFQRLSFSH